MTTPADDLAAVLARSRAHPLPYGARPVEPADADAWLADRFAETAARRGPAGPPPPAAVRDAPVPELGVTDLLAAYAGGALDPEQVLEQLSARWGPGGPADDAVLRPVPGAQAAAQESAQRWRSGRARPLEGVPFGVKDIIDVAGAVVTCGSRQTGDRVAPTDATAVARLRQAGAIPVAVLATSEYACGAPHNGRYGPVANPWDRARWTGGSSTGSAAAVAARLLPLALGTDTAGSVRVPAAMCGVTGLKPTRGLVPRTGVATLSWTLDHVGPLARSAADLAAVLPHLAGPDGTDPSCPPGAGLSAVPTGLRVGVPAGWFVERCDRAVLAAWQATLDVLADVGAALVPVDVGPVALAHEEAWLVLYVELLAVQDGRAEQLFDDGTRARLSLGRLVPAADHLRALRRRVLVQRQVHAAMAGVDVLVTPGAGTEAPLLSDLLADVDGRPWPMQAVASRNTMLFDLTGHPAVMAPAGLGRHGLPVGVQVVGRPYDDALCLAVAATVQARTGWHLAKPG